MKSVITGINNFYESLGIALMTLIRVRCFHVHFRACQLSECLRLGEKALDHSYGREVQCSVTANTAFDFSLSLSQSNCNGQTMIYLEHCRGSFTSAWDVKLC